MYVLFALYVVWMTRNLLLSFGLHVIPDLKPDHPFVFTHTHTHQILVCLFFCVFRVVFYRPRECVFFVCVCVLLILSIA